MSTWSDDFTAGADEWLSARASWAQATVDGHYRVFAATGHVYNTVSDNGIYRYTPSGGPTGTQKNSALVTTAASSALRPQICAWIGASTAECYLISLLPGFGVRLHHTGTDGSLGTALQEYTGANQVPPTSSSLTAYIHVEDKTTYTSIKWSIDNGAHEFEYQDSAGGRLTSGYPGIGGGLGTDGADFFDSMVVDDLAGAATPDAPSSVTAHSPAVATGHAIATQAAGGDTPTGIQFVYAPDSSGSPGTPVTDGSPETPPGAGLTVEHEYAAEFVPGSAIWFGAFATNATGDSATTWASAAVTISGQILRPLSIASAGGWTGGAADINEVVPNDATYIEGPVATLTPAVCIVRLDPGLIPAARLEHKFEYYYQKDLTGGDAVDLTVELVEETATDVWTLRGTANTHTAIDANTLGTITLSEAEANAITDYEALGFRLTQVLGA